MIIRILLLVAMAAAIVLMLKVARPRLREQRHRSWEQAGLLPHQIDPHAPPPPDARTDRRD